MAEVTKIMLSEPELEKVQDSEWILTKHGVIKKVFELFNLQVPVISNAFATKPVALPAAVKAAIPKISKGENYKLLPYVILDYPGVFSREDVFALRTMFWWGNFFSVTMHLSGTYKDLFAAQVLSSLHEDPAGLYVCVNEDQWEHWFGPENYMQATACSKEMLTALVMEKPFLKIARRYSLADWNSMPLHLEEGYERFVKMLEDQLPTR